jgi:hypothetical protein
MNQYRCETCLYDPCEVGFDGCPVWSKFPYDDEERGYKISLLGQIRVTSQYSGCASHSDFQNQREKVLDELNSWIEKDKWTRIGEDEKPDNRSQEEWDGYVNGRFVFGERVQTKIKELRGEQ